MKMLSTVNNFFANCSSFVHADYKELTPSVIFVAYSIYHVDENTNYNRYISNKNSFLSFLFLFSKTINACVYKLIVILYNFECVVLCVMTPKHMSVFKNTAKVDYKIHKTFLHS